MDAFLSRARAATIRTEALTPPSAKGALCVGMSVVAHAALLVAASSVPSFASVPREPDVALVSIEVLAEPEPALAPEPAPAIVADAVAPPVARAPRVVHEAPAALPPEAPPPEAIVEAPSDVTLTAIAPSATSAFVVSAPTAVAGAASAAATPAATASASVSAPGPDLRALTRSWVGRIGQLIGQRALREYPRAARRAGLQGLVVLAVTVDTQGHLAAVEVSHSSGHEILDEAAIDAVRAIGALPPPPADLAWRPRPLTVPVAYRLQ